MGKKNTHEEQREADTQRAKEAAQKFQKQQKKIEELVPTVEGLEYIAAKYSSRLEEILPEIGTLKLIKFYRDKN